MGHHFISVRPDLVINLLRVTKIELKSEDRIKLSYTDRSFTLLTDFGEATASECMDFLRRELEATAFPASELRRRNHQCPHDHLDSHGICRSCGSDRLGIRSEE